ncbi:MAG TPA: holo-ACP synthase [Clostridiales bacterium]|nr:holo-ACP synthase [Clostridiales bacterium]HPV01938.1 holo-ACP synthase [Clostridiales bacterium]
MAIRCGVDIIEIDRIRKSLEELESFRNRVFTGHEISYCEGRNRARYESYAARFAAKEAVLKALGTGMSDGLEWKDIEIRNDEKGKPGVFLTGRALEIFRTMGALSIDISLSHCGSYAVAFVVIETSGTD